MGSSRVAGICSGDPVRFFAAKDPRLNFDRLPAGKGYRHRPASADFSTPLQPSFRRTPESRDFRLGPTFLDSGVRRVVGLFYDTPQFLLRCAYIVITRS
jgi:hypothetical protein